MTVMERTPRHPMMGETGYWMSRHSRAMLGPARPFVLSLMESSRRFRRFARRVLNAAEMHTLLWMWERVSSQIYYPRHLYTHSAAYPHSILFIKVTKCGKAERRKRIIVGPLAWGVRRRAFHFMYCLSIFALPGCLRVSLPTRGAALPQRSCLSAARNLVARMPPGCWWCRRNTGLPPRQGCTGGASGLSSKVTSRLRTVVVTYQAQ